MQEVWRHLSQHLEQSEAAEEGDSPPSLAALGDAPSPTNAKIYIAQTQAQTTSLETSKLRDRAL